MNNSLSIPYTFKSGNLFILDHSFSNVQSFTLEFFNKLIVKTFRKKELNIDQSLKLYKQIIKSFNNHKKREQKKETLGEKKGRKKCLHFTNIDKNEHLNMINQFVLSSNILDEVVNDVGLVSRFVKHHNDGFHDPDAVRLTKELILEKGKNSKPLLKILLNSGKLNNLLKYKTTRTEIYTALFDLGYQSPCFKFIDEIYSKLKNNLLDNLILTKNLNASLSVIDASVKDFLISHKAHAVFSIIDDKNCFHYCEFSVSIQNFSTFIHCIDKKSLIAFNKLIKNRKIDIKSIKFAKAYRLINNDVVSCDILNNIK